MENYWVKEGDKEHLPPSLQIAYTIKRIIPDIIRFHLCFLTPMVIHSRNFLSTYYVPSTVRGSEEMTGKFRVRAPPLESRGRYRQ